MYTLHDPRSPPTKESVRLVDFTRDIDLFFAGLGLYYTNDCLLSSQIDQDFHWLQFPEILSQAIRFLVFSEVHISTVQVFLLPTPRWRKRPWVSWISLCPRSPPAGSLFKHEPHPTPRISP